MCSDKFLKCVGVKFSFSIDIVEIICLFKVVVLKEFVILVLSIELNMILKFLLLVCVVI